MKSFWKGILDKQQGADNIVNVVKGPKQYWLNFLYKI